MKRISNIKWTQRLITAACLTAGLAVAPSHAQSLKVDTTTVSVESITSSNGAGAFNSMKSNPKVTALVAKANAVLGGTFTPDPSKGFSTKVKTKFQRDSGVSMFDTELTFVPLKGTPSKAGTSGVLAIYRYIDAPDLTFARLLVQAYPGDWSVQEFSMRRDGTVTEMSAKHGDCVFRSALMTLEQMQPDAHTSLRKVLNADAAAKKPLIEALRRVYDERAGSFGQKNLGLATTLYVAGNWEEEFDGGYVDGAINKIKPEKRGDSKAVKEAKKLGKELLNQVLKRLKDQITGWLKGIKL